MVSRGDFDPLNSGSNPDGATKNNFKKESVDYMISYRVMRIQEFSNSIIYKIDCACGYDDHSIKMEIEHDSEFADCIYLKFIKNVEWCDKSDKWYNKILDRLKCALTVLLTGYIQTEEVFILQGNDHIDAFIEAIQNRHEKFPKERFSDSVEKK